MNEFDLIVIGSGSGNIVLDAALEQGLNCALIEKSVFGGTCLNHGCQPSKILVTAANLLRDAKRGERLGVMAGPLEVDWPLLTQRIKDKISINKEIRKEYLEDPNTTVYEGSASFVGMKTLQVTAADGRESEPLTAEKIVIATGGVSRLPKIKGLWDEDFITAEQFFGERFPEAPYRSIAIMGGGPIGCEFAHALSAMGSEVHLIQRNRRLLPHEDSEISAVLLSQMKDMGIDVHLNTVIAEVEHPHNQTDTHSESDKPRPLRLFLTPNDDSLDVKGSRETIDVDIILLAGGIVPQADLNPENSGIELDDRGWIRTNELLQTSVPGIYALGDCNGGFQFRHKANYEAEILAHNLYGGADGGPAKPENWQWACYKAMPFVTYTYPELAHLGQTEDQLIAAGKKRGVDYRVGHLPFSDTAKGYALGYMPDDDSQPGFTKIISDMDGHILGVHIIGHDASILLQPFIDQMTMSLAEEPFRPVNKDIVWEEQTVADRRPDKTRAKMAIPATETWRRWRECTPYKLEPNTLDTIEACIVPHPSLTEASAWVTAYMED